MEKRQGLFVFIDTRASTTRIYSDVEYFEDFITETLTFILAEFRRFFVFPSCKCKPLGDGLLIYYTSETNLADDNQFKNLLKNILDASISCVSGYDKVMRGKSPRDNDESKKYQLGISIGSGYLYDFEYKVSESKVERIEDIGSIDLTYVFRLNKFAHPEGIVVDNHLYDAHREVFEQFGGFTSKRKSIDDAFGYREIYVSKEVILSEDESNVVKAYRELGDFAIQVCHDIIQNEIDNKTYPLDAVPQMRFLLFKCHDNTIEEVYNLYAGYEGGKKDSFEIKPEREIYIDDKYPHLIYECYYQRKIVYFSYRNRYIKNLEGYIKDSTARFYINQDVSKIKEFFAGFTLKASSSLAIPIMDSTNQEVKWILDLDSEETKVFKRDFFEPLGLAVRTYFNKQFIKVLENADKPPR